jgi:hypothetical protein
VVSLRGNGRGGKGPNTSGPQNAGSQFLSMSFFEVSVLNALACTFKPTQGLLLAKLSYARSTARDLPRVQRHPKNR